MEDETDEQEVWSESKLSNRLNYLSRDHLGHFSCANIKVVPLRKPESLIDCGQNDSVLQAIEQCQSHFDLPLRGLAFHSENMSVCCLHSAEDFLSQNRALVDVNDAR